jgi:hypothetical protein
LGEFRSGAWEQSGSPVRSGVSLDGELRIDLSNYTGGTGTHDLIRVDVLQGMVDAVRVHGLRDGYQAKAVIDFGADVLQVRITRGDAAASVDIIGAPDAGGDEPAQLWEVLTAGEGAFDAGVPDVTEGVSAILEPDFLF